MKRKIPSRSEAELKQLAVDMIANRIFTSWQIREGDMIRSVFMPIAFGALEDIDVHDIGCLYAPMSSAGPRAINGYPIFMSVALLNRVDASKVMVYYKTAVEAQQRVLQEVMDAAPEPPPQPLNPPES